MLYETVNDQQCGGDCLNFNTSNLITGAAKENFIVHGKYIGMMVKSF